MDSPWLPVYAAAAVGVAGLTLAISRRRSPWDYLDGPPSNSLIFGSYIQTRVRRVLNRALFTTGNQREFMRGEVGLPEFEWLEKYGSVYTVKGVLGVRRIPCPSLCKRLLTLPRIQKTRLFISDPKAMQYVWGTPASGHLFAKPSFGRAFIKDLVGPSILWVEGTSSV